jgi:hypothetical protein
MVKKRWINAGMDNVWVGWEWLGWGDEVWGRKDHFLFLSEELSGTMWTIEGGNECGLEPVILTWSTHFLVVYN